MRKLPLPGVKAIVFLVLAGVLLDVPARVALAGSIYSFVDERGVVHFSNCPADPRYLSGSGRGAFSTGLSAGMRARWSLRLDRELRKAISGLGLDPDLIRAIIQVESGGRPLAVSPKGAVGLMQLMPETARELRVEDPTDPVSNIRGGARYLKRMLERFGGDLLLALAAYNAGPGAVDRYKGLPPYPETRDYVRRVLESWKACKRAPSSPHVH